MRPSALVLLLALPGCPTLVAPPCGEFDETFVWADLDGDGFGRDEPVGYVCAVGEGQAANNADCDDDDPSVNPGGVEVCDLADNDCNDRVDETEPKVVWYHDADGDGFGSNIDLQFACKSPGADWLESSGDCDDDISAVNPLAIEVCNQGIDDDCDTLADDADGGVDPTTYSAWYRDNDGDSFGDGESERMSCAAPPGAVEDASDCDDGELVVNPAAIEICDRIDNDCDLFVDDADDSVDPATQDQYFADGDGDGYGDAANLTLACEPTPGIGVTNDDDCDDTDPLAYVEQWWGLDVDGDGAGDGAQLVYQCLNPGVGTAPAGSGIDCEPNDPDIFPLQSEDCFDGIDQDCDAAVDCLDADCSVEPSCLPPCADDVIIETALPIQLMGSTVGQGDQDAGTCYFASGAHDLVYHFVPAQTRLYTIDTNGSLYDTALVIRAGCGGAQLACDDDAGVGTQSLVNVNLQAGVPVLIVVDGYSSNSGQFTLNIN